ncbi:hypothetical protein [Billgrantia kenyensis]|uniref:Uncharacterized protein n=1 Tax=Billgrantia kenyensis TaxID=321266 RepID=A0A7V9W2T6_9GAMM|nr:hypothetical protein [Halomonas kenyensis]MBA2780004.1 hypothetical protein [Halomonas kenyensis]MCG6662981.1 hypothetical protein [Halomonas kenyensis]
MRTEAQAGAIWLTMGAMLLAAALALWLLVRPELISGMSMALRLPVIALGVWALGAAFMRPLGLEFRRHWLCQATQPAASLVALAIFTAIVLLRALWLT